MRTRKTNTLSTKPVPSTKISTYITIFSSKLLVGVAVVYVTLLAFVAELFAASLATFETCVSAAGYSCSDIQSDLLSDECNKWKLQVFSRCQRFQLLITY